MAKEPHPGRVKTRLAAGIGNIPAVWWARHRLTQLGRTLRDPRWRVTLAVAPDRTANAALFPNLPHIPQGPGTLGDRMARLLRTTPPGRVFIIGTDIPAISPNHIQVAFGEIARHGAAIGPTPDGGYWGIGLDNRRRLAPDLLTHIRWSTEHALADTLLHFPAPAFLATLADVDTTEDLARLST